eukprot:scaffold230861_cov31-Tisochrysis_lutea.AAC.2
MLRSSLRAAALSLSLSGGVARGRRAASGSSRQLLAALIERIPLVTPELPAWKTDSLRRQQKICTSLAKVYPTEFTTAEEGPDRKQARLRAAAIITDEASREGAADANADETSTDRKLVRAYRSSAARISATLSLQVMLTWTVRVGHRYHLRRIACTWSCAMVTRGACHVWSGRRTHRPWWRAWEDTSQRRAGRT